METQTSSIQDATNMTPEEAHSWAYNCYHELRDLCISNAHQWRASHLERERDRFAHLLRTRTDEGILAHFRQYPSAMDYTTWPK